MSGPWEKYAAEAPKAEGPWARYAGTPASAASAAPAANVQPQRAAAGLLGATGAAGGDLLAGAVRGAGSIGATLLAPLDIARDALSGKGLTLESNRQRRQDMDAALRELGADTDSTAFSVGKLGAEVAGTLGVGGALAPAARALGASPAAAQAIVTSGMRTGAAPASLAGRVGDMALRSAGGAVTGGASAALVNPDDAAGGAAIGAALPPALKAVAGGARAVGKAAQLTGSELANTFKDDTTRAAAELVHALDLRPDQLPGVVAALRAASSGVPGITPTVGQALTSPQAAILERVVASGPGGEKLRLALQQQMQRRVEALRGVVPGAAGKTSIEAAENLGQLAAAEGAEVEGWLKGAIKQQYGSPALANATLRMPGEGAARAAVETFYPGAAFDEAPADLRRLIARLDNGAPVPFGEFDALRKAAGNRVRDLAESDRTASAAWAKVRDLFYGGEQAALAQADRLRPTGQGPFGPVYGGLTGDPENAVAHLLRTGAGEVPGALSHRQVKHPIDLIWGHPGTGNSDGAGLAKLNAFHPEALRDLQGLLNRTSIRPEASGLNRLRMAGPNGEDAVVSLNWRGDPKTWLLSAFERNPESAGRSMNLPGALGEGAAASTPAALADIVPDIGRSFQAFDAALNPPAPTRDPRAYVGDLFGALDPAAAEAVAAGRSLHRDLVHRFREGPWVYAARKGADGLPMAQGAELARRFVNGGASQAADVQALKKGVLDRGPTMQAAREFALADLFEKAVSADGRGGGTLSAPALRNAIEGRRLMLGELLEPTQLQGLFAVRDEALRAAEAARRGLAVGSNTYQNTVNALDAGLLGSPLAKALSTRVPVLRAVAEPWRAGLAESASKAKASRLAELLADPAAAAAALEGQVPSRSAAAARHLMDMGDTGLATPLPGLGLSLQELLQVGAYKVPPLFATQ